MISSRATRAIRQRRDEPAADQNPRMSQREHPAIDAVRNLQILDDGRGPHILSPGIETVQQYRASASHNNDLRGADFAPVDPTEISTTRPAS